MTPLTPILGAGAGLSALIVVRVRAGELVLAAGLGSAAALAAIVQTPAVSGLVGCRHLGPLGWTQAVTAAGLATTAAVVLPGLLTPTQKQA